MRKSYSDTEDHKCKEMPDYMDVWYIPIYRQWYLVNHDKRLITKGIKYCTFCGAKLE